MVRRIFCGSLIFGRLANVRRAPKRFDRKREPRCACGRWRRAGCRRRRGPYATSGRRRRSRPGLRNRRARGCSGQKWPQIARKRMISAPNAAFRVDRSPSLCSAGRFDIIELLHGDLHRLRRPQGARHSPKASRPRSGEWSPRPFAAASGPQSRFVRPARPSTVPTAAAGGWTAKESALERLQGLKIAHFHLNLLLHAVYPATADRPNSPESRPCRVHARESKTLRRATLESHMEVLLSENELF